VTFPGGNPPQRPDQLLQPLSRAGTGPAPQSAIFIGHLVIIFGTGITGLFQYQGTPSHGNGPILWAVPPGVTTDPFGNTLPASGGIVSEAAGGGLLAQLFAGELIFGDTLSAYPLTYNGLLRIIHAAAVGSTAVVALDSPAGDVNESHASLWMIGAPPAGGSFVQAALFGDGTGGEIPLHFIVCGQMSFGVLSGGVPAANLPSLGPNTIAGNDGMLLAPTGSPTSATTTLWEVQGATALANAGAPASVTGYAEPYATSGALGVVDGTDGNSYDTERAVADAAASQAITAVNATYQNVTGAAWPVAARSYDIDVECTYTEAAAGTPRFQFTSPAFSTAWLTARWQQNNASASFGGRSLAALGPVAGPVMAGNAQILTLRGRVTFTAAGTLQLQANTSVMGDSYTFNVGRMTVCPVVAS
jgi:hypothetical protein